MNSNAEESDTVSWLLAVGLILVMLVATAYFVALEAGVEL